MLESTRIGPAGFSVLPIRKWLVRHLELSVERFTVLPWKLRLLPSVSLVTLQEAETQWLRA